MSMAKKGHTVETSRVLEGIVSIPEEIVEFTDGELAPKGGEKMENEGVVGIEQPNVSEVAKSEFVSTEAYEALTRETEELKRQLAKTEAKAEMMAKQAQAFEEKLKGVMHKECELQKELCFKSFEGVLAKSEMEAVAERFADVADMEVLKEKLYVAAAKKHFASMQKSQAPSGSMMVLPVVEETSVPAKKGYEALFEKYAKGSIS